MTTETMNLPVPLTQQELDQRRDKLVSLLMDRAKLEMEKKLAMNDIAKRAKGIDRDVRTIAEEIRAKSEYRPVEVVRVRNYRAGIEEVRRMDTDEIVDSRVLTADERQVEMHLGPGVDDIEHLRTIVKKRREEIRAENTTGDDA